MEKDTEELNHELREAKDAEEFLTENQENFREYALREYLELLMKEKNLSKAEIIVKSQLEQVYAYHIFAGRKKKPSRNKILSIALAMKLNLKETQRLLYYAGSEELYPKNSRDSVIIYAINNQMNVADTNALLQNLSVKPLLVSI